MERFNMEDITVSVEEMINFIFKKCGESVDKDTIAMQAFRRSPTDIHIITFVQVECHFYRICGIIMVCFVMYNIKTI